MFNQKEYMKKYRKDNEEKIRLQKNNYMKIYRDENKDKINLKQRSRKKEQRAYYIKKKDIINARKRKWYNKHKIELAVKRQNYINKNPDKVIQWKQNNVIASKISRTNWENKNKNNPDVIFKKKVRKIASRIPIPLNKKCKYCNELATDRHHPDYNKPKEVEYLCRKHHRILHSNLSVEDVKPLQLIGGQIK
jgi:hypothetical protein